MSFEKFKSDSFCVGGRHKCATKNIYGDITSKDNNVLIRFCSICNRKNLWLLVIMLKSEGLVSVFKKLGIVCADAGKKLATNALKNPAGFLENGANVATAVASRNPKAALSTLPEVINFHHTGRGLYLPRFTYLMLYKSNKRLLDYTHLHH